MPRNPEPTPVEIPIRPSLGVLGRKWTARLLMDIGMRRIGRFNQIMRANPGLPRRLLSKRLRELEAEQVIRRRKARGSATAVRWSLTPKGTELLPILMELVKYGSKWNAPYRSNGRPPRLQTEGSPTSRRD